MEVDPSHGDGLHHGIPDSSQEQEVERLLSERLVEGYVLLEKGCPACATPLVKRYGATEFKRKQMEPVPFGGGGGETRSICSGYSGFSIPHDSQSFEAPIRPIEGVPFCVWCQAHVVTEAEEVLRLEGADHYKVRGSIMVAMSKESLEDNDTLATVIESLAEDGSNSKSKSRELSFEAISKENDMDQSRHRHLRPDRTSSRGDDPPSSVDEDLHANNSIVDSPAGGKLKVKKDGNCEEYSLTESLTLSCKAVSPVHQQPKALDNGFVLSCNKANKDQQMSLDDDEVGNNDYNELKGHGSPKDVVNRVESLLNLDEDEDDEAYDGDESIEEIEVVHVDEASECSEIERKINEQNSATGATMAERLVVTISAAGTDDSDDNNDDVESQDNASWDEVRSDETVSKAESRGNASLEKVPSSDTVSKAESRGNVSPEKIRSSDTGSKAESPGKVSHQEVPVQNTVSQTDSRSKVSSNTSSNASSKRTQISDSHSKASSKKKLKSDSRSTTVSFKEDQQSDSRSKASSRMVMRDDSQSKAGSKTSSKIVQQADSHSKASSRSKASFKDARVADSSSKASSKKIQQAESRSTASSSQKIKQASDSRSKASSKSSTSILKQEKMQLANDESVKELAESVIATTPADDASGDRSKTTSAHSKDSSNQASSLSDESTPLKNAASMMSYETRRLMATKILGKKMLQGYNLTEQQCVDCQMPLMEKKSAFFCVVCPVIRKRVIEGGDTAKTDTKASKSSKSVAKERETAKLAPTGSKTSKLSVATAKSKHTASVSKQSKQSKAPVHSKSASSKSQKKNAEANVLKEAVNSSQARSQITPVEEADDLSTKLSSLSESYATTFSVTSSFKDAGFRASTLSNKPTLNTSVYAGSAKETGRCEKFSKNKSTKAGKHSSAEHQSRSHTRSSKKTVNTRDDEKLSPNPSTVINPFADLSLASLTPPTLEKQKMMEEAAAQLLAEAEQAEKECPASNTRDSLDDHERVLNESIKSEKEIVRRETKRLNVLEKLRREQKEKSSDMGSISGMSSHMQRQVFEVDAKIQRKIEESQKAKEEAEINVRHLIDEKRAHREAQLLSELEKEAARKQKEAEEAMEKAKHAIEEVSLARQQFLAETIAEGEASVIAETESIIRLQAEDYHEQVILPTASDLHRERWEILRAEGRSIMTRRVMAGWTVLPELCRGEECDGSPLLLDGNVKQCVVCGGPGDGTGGVYALPAEEDEEEDEEYGIVGGSSLASSRVKPPKEIKISTPRLNIKPQTPHKNNVDERSVANYSSVKPMPKTTAVAAASKPKATADAAASKKAGKQSRASNLSKTSVSSMASSKHVENLQQNFESKRAMVTKEIGKRMMKGWNLVDASCPYCVMPLMTDLDQKNEICVLCGVVATIADKPVEKSIKTWTKGERVHASHQLAEESRKKPPLKAAGKGNKKTSNKKSGDVLRQKDNADQKRLKKELLRELVIDETKKATERLEKALKEKMQAKQSASEAVLTDGRSEIEGDALSGTKKSSDQVSLASDQGVIADSRDNSTGRVSPKKNDISPIHFLQSRGRAREVGESLRVDPPAGKSNGIRLTKPVDAEESIGGVRRLSPKPQEAKEEAENTLDEEIKQEESKENPSQVTLHTLHIPKDFDVTDETSLRELIRVAQIENAAISNERVRMTGMLGVDTKAVLRRKHPMVHPSPGMTECSMPGTAPSPAFVSKKMPKKVPSAELLQDSPVSDRLPARASSPGLSSIQKNEPQNMSYASGFDSPGGFIYDGDIDIPIHIPTNSRAKPIRQYESRFPESPGGSRLDTRSKRPDIALAQLAESRLETSSVRSRDAPEGRRLERYSIANLSPQESWVSTGSRPRVTPESIMRPRASSRSWSSSSAEGHQERMLRMANASSSLHGSTSAHQDRKLRMANKIPSAATSVSTSQANASPPGITPVPSLNVGQSLCGFAGFSSGKEENEDEALLLTVGRSRSFDRRRSRSTSKRSSSLEIKPVSPRQESDDRPITIWSRRDRNEEEKSSEDRPESAWQVQSRKSEERPDPILAVRRKVSEDSRPLPSSEDSGVEEDKPVTKSKQWQSREDGAVRVDSPANRYRLALQRTYTKEEKPSPALPGNQSREERSVRTLPERASDIEDFMPLPTLHHPLLVRGVPHEPNANTRANKYRRSSRRMIVVPGVEAIDCEDDSLPGSLPTSVHGCDRVQGKDVILVEGGPSLRSDSASMKSRSSYKSAGTETLDAILARIEDTKRQLEQAPVVSADSRAKPKQLRKLIENLATAAAEIEKQDRIEMDMNLCFPLK